MQADPGKRRADDPHARPQIGFNAASVVYEMPAEFDLTRFLVIYFADAPTTFVDASGGNISLPPGRVFWEVVPIESKVQLLS